MKHAINIQHLSFAYQREGQATTILENLSLSLEPGKISVLMGPSGCGKSTLLRILMGVEQGGRGTLSTDELSFDFQQWNQDQSIFGLVPQVPHLLPWKTVYQNIALAVPTAFTKEQRERKVYDVLNVIQLADYANRYPADLSHGMASRVAFARTLVMDIKAILLDEPFAALDAITRRHLQQWTATKVAESQLPALFVTHDVSEALLLGSNIYILSTGPARLVEVFPAGKASADAIYQMLNISPNSRKQ